MTDRYGPDQESCRLHVWPVGGGQDDYAKRLEDKGMERVSFDSICMSSPKSRIPALDSGSGGGSTPSLCTDVCRDPGRGNCDEPREPLTVCHRGGLNYACGE